jgi:hypothetical protein
VNASNVELLAQAFAGWGKDNPVRSPEITRLGLVPGTEVLRNG